MRYYVVSANVFNDGNCEAYADFMIRRNVVCVGYDESAMHGRRFQSQLRCGDRVIVARRQNYHWKAYFAGIVDGVVKKHGIENGQYTLARDVRSVIDFRDSQRLLNFSNGMTAYGRKNPGTLFELHPNSNGADAVFVKNLEKLISGIIGERIKHADKPGDNQYGTLAL